MSEQFALIVQEGHAVNQENFTGLLDVKDEKFIISGLHVIWRKEDNRSVLHNILKEIQQLANKFKTS